MMTSRASGEDGRPALRALRQQPLMVDVRAAHARLRTEDSGAESVLADGSPRIPDVERWASAWLVCAQAALSMDPRYLRDDPWTIPLRLSAMYLPRRGDDRDRLAQAIEGLAAAGIVSVTGDEGSGRTVFVDRHFFMPHPAGIALDWKESLAVCGNEPATLLVLHALAEVIVPLDAWTAVPRRDLMDATGYQQKQVRVALRRLERAGLLDAEGDPGVTARYRFSGRALGRHWEMSDSASTPSAVAATVKAELPVRVEVRGPSLDTATSTSAEGAAAGSAGLRVTVGGVTITLAPGAQFAIGAGVEARLEMGADGKPVLLVGSTFVP